MGERKPWSRLRIALIGAASASLLVACATDPSNGPPGSTSPTTVSPSDAHARVEESFGPAAGPPRLTLRHPVAWTRQGGEGLVDHYGYDDGQIASFPIVDPCPPSAAACATTPVGVMRAGGVVVSVGSVGGPPGASVARRDGTVSTVGGHPARYRAGAPTTAQCPTGATWSSEWDIADRAVDDTGYLIVVACTAGPSDDDLQHLVVAMIDTVQLPS